MEHKKIYAVLDHDKQTENFDESWIIISADGDHLLITGKGRSYHDALQEFRRNMPAGALFRLTNLHLVDKDTRYFVINEEHECALLLNNQIDFAVELDKKRAKRDYRDERNRRDIIEEIILYDY